jgi:hypothetical protein
MNLESLTLGLLFFRMYRVIRPRGSDPDEHLKNRVFRSISGDVEHV